MKNLINTRSRDAEADAEDDTQKRVVPAVMRPSRRRPKGKPEVQRRKWTIAVFFAYHFRDAINTAFYYKTRGETGGNIVIRHLAKHAVLDSRDDWKIDYAKVMLSKGKLRNILHFEASLNDQGLLKLNWLELGVEGNKDAPEKLFLSFYNEDKDLSHCIEQPINQADLQTELRLPFFEGACQYHLWIFEMSKGNRYCGNTFYVRLNK